jgi:hypothetical protein
MVSEHSTRAHSNSEPYRGTKLLLGLSLILWQGSLGGYMARIAYRQPKFHGHDEPYLFITYRIIHHAISGLDEPSDISWETREEYG